MAKKLVINDLKSGAKEFFLGFFNPGMFGIYVLVGILSAVIFSVYYYGYGCWFRVGPVFELFFLPTVCILILMVVSAGWMQAYIWRRAFKRPEINTMSWLELLSRALIAAVIVLPLSAGIGAKVRETKAYRICRDCNVLVTELENWKKLHGIYPNGADLVKANKNLSHKYFFYYGQSDTNGIDWDPSEIANASISFFVTTNTFQIVVPIEKMSPVTFSSFFVYSCSSEHPFWNKTLLHWSIEGAYVDEPGE